MLQVNYRSPCTMKKDEQIFVIVLLQIFLAHLKFMVAPVNRHKPRPLLCSNLDRYRSRSEPPFFLPHNNLAPPTSLSVPSKHLSIRPHDRVKDVNRTATRTHWRLPSRLSSRLWWMWRTAALSSMLRFLFNFLSKGTW